MRTLRVRALLVVIGLLAPACGMRGLSFVTDDRVDITAPRDRSAVVLPLKVEWTVDDFAVGDTAGSFGVLVDQAPPRPGKTLPWLFRDRDVCRGDTGTRLCATRAFLAERNVFSTTRTSFTVERVDRFTGNDRRRVFHEVTVVLLDEHGRRVGEGAWSVQFEVERDVG